MFYIQYTFNDSAKVVSSATINGIQNTLNIDPCPLQLVLGPDLPQAAPPFFRIPQLVSSIVVFRGSVMPSSGPFPPILFFVFLLISCCLTSTLEPLKGTLSSFTLRCDPSILWSSNLNIRHDIQIFVNTINVTIPLFCNHQIAPS